MSNYLSPRFSGKDHSDEVSGNSVPIGENPCSGHTVVSPDFIHLCLSQFMVWTIFAFRFAKYITSAWTVEIYVLFYRFTQHKIFNPIIRCVTVDVMDNLALFKKSPNVLFHDKTVLKHSSSSTFAFLRIGVMTSHEDVAF